MGLCKIVRHWARSDILLTASGTTKGSHAMQDICLCNVKHAFHALARNEKKDYSVPTLFEQNPKPADMRHFEQCWFPGDHANIGGGWNDTKIAVNSIASMMSRLLARAVVDQRYIYFQFKQGRYWFKANALDLDRSTDNE